ncbi:MAG: hypothetical protein QOI70_791 [Microbacteriaceae bacterium]|jgi:hypothetical protein|nr:hypothetical protein [Microbacteriaceae bacterium]
MKRVAYGGESFITSDEAAEALLAFAAAAAMSDVAEVVPVPSVRDDGAVVVVELVIGPSSELITSPVDSRFPEPDTRSSTAALRARASELISSNPHATGGAIHGQDLDSSDRDLDSSDLDFQ